MLAYLLNITCTYFIKKNIKCCEYFDVILKIMNWWNLYFIGKIYEIKYSTLEYL